MKIKRNVMPIWACAVVFAAVAWSLENPSVRSPVGGAVVPPSGVQSGLIRSPNPMGTIPGNLIVTGNVGGGKQFRGRVPYNATSDFLGRTGTEPVDSFLRYSSGSELYGQYTGKLTPYYSQTRTVTYSTPGVGVVGPETAYKSYRYEAAQLSTSQQSNLAVPQPQFVRPGKDTSFSKTYLTGMRPMGMPLEDMEKLIAAEGEITPRGRQELAQKQQAQMQQFEEALKQAGDKAADLERKLNYKGDVLQQPTQEQAVPQTKGQAVPQTPEQISAQPSGEQVKKENLVVSKQLQGPLPLAPQNIYEQMRQQLAMQQKGRKPIMVLKRELEEAKAAEKKTTVEGKPKLDEKGAQTTEKPLENLSQEEIANRAKSILGEYKSFATFSQDRFNRYMVAGEKYLKEGKYYLAADAYTIASIYKPDDPLAYAGKSHALFAAGEYMSSALYLSRALTIFPEYAQFKVDIIGMVGDKDKLESRIADVQEWLKKSEAPELDFLLAYVYYQMGRPGEAKKSIDAAYEKMPDAPAVKTLKDAIYGTTQ